MRKKVLALVLALVMVIAMLPTVAFAADFADTKGHWAETQIDRWAEAGVVEGTGTGFNPNGSMTRSEAAKTFANLLKLSTKDDLTAYTDVPTDEWKVEALAKAVAKGIIKGTSATTLSPDGTLTREQMFVMVGRALGIEPVETATKTFADGAETSDWAEGYINALADMGVINGVGNNMLDPAADINRASAMTVLDNLIGGYANEDGQTVEIVPGKVTLVVADDVKVTGEADPTVPIVVAGEAKTVDLEGVTVTEDAAPVVQVQVSDVTVENAPVGAEVKADEGTTGVTANGIDVSADADKDVVIPESTPSTPSTPTPPPAPPAPATNAAEEAADDTWTALKGVLTELGLEKLIIADGSEGTYTLTLDANEISANSAAVESSKLDGLMNKVKGLLDENFDEATLKVNVDGTETVVYENKAFNNTGLKAALVYAANGFFVKLSTMEDTDGVYKYMDLTGQVTSGSDTKDVTLAIQLKGTDVEKIQALATKFAEYLSMEQLSAQDITAKYGTVNGLTGENKYIVVGVKLPTSISNITSNIPKDTFTQMTVSQAFTALKGYDVPSLLGDDDKSNVESALKTINSNKDLINKILGKMTISINGTNVTNSFNPDDSADTVWKKFIGGVAAMFGTGDGTVGNTAISTYATGTGNYYAVPVKVEINLNSMEFNATETIVVILEIPLQAEG